MLKKMMLLVTAMSLVVGSMTAYAADGNDPAQAALLKKIAQLEKRIELETKMLEPLKKAQMAGVTWTVGRRQFIEVLIVGGAAAYAMSGGNANKMRVLGASLMALGFTEGGFFLVDKLTLSREVESLEGRIRLAQAELDELKAKL